MMNALPRAVALVVTIACVGAPRAHAAEPVSPSYEAFAAFRGPALPDGAIAVANLARRDARAPRELLFILPRAAPTPASTTRLPGRGPWHTGRLFVDVTVADGETLAEVGRALAHASGVGFVDVLRVGNWLLFDAHTPTRFADVVPRLRAHPRVRRVEADTVRRFRIASPVDDALFPDQWHLENTGQRADEFELMSAGSDIRAKDAWEVTTGDPSVVIAVIDSGQDPLHPDFAEPGKIVSPFDTAFLDDDAAPDPGSGIGAHGIACAGLAAASQAGSVGVVGVCPDCTVMPIRLFTDLGFGSDTAVVDAFAHALEAGAHIASNSWAYWGEGFPSVVGEAVNQFATEARDGKGGVVVFAAGNLGVAMNAWDLAMHPHALAVGGSGADDTRVGYASFGEGLDVVAPTGHALAYGEVNGELDPIPLGPQLVTTDRPDDEGYNPLMDDYYDPGFIVDTDYTGAMNGTSGACPQVAGLAGLVLALAPTLTAGQVFDVVIRGAEKVGGVEYDATGWHEEYGHGRIHAAATLALVESGDLCPPSVEVCDDGADNDCDAAIDALDPDCGFVLPPIDVPFDEPCVYLELTGDPEIDPPPMCGAGACFGDVGEGGICVASCNSGVCPDGAVCVEHPGGDDVWMPICLAACNDDDGCGPASSCTATAEGMACLPLCALDDGGPVCTEAWYPVPETWTCGDAAFLDDVCDCGCGDFDWLACTSFDVEDCANAPACGSIDLVDPFDTRFCLPGVDAGVDDDVDAGPEADVDAGDDAEESDDATDGDDGPSGSSDDDDDALDDDDENGEDALTCSSTTTQSTALPIELWVALFLVDVVTRHRACYHRRRCGTRALRCS